MKKTIILSLIAVCLMFTFMDTAFSQETLTHGCYNWRRGTLRIVANPNQCVPSYENHIPWHKAIPPGGFTLYLYVNGTTGQDLPGRGLTPADPFQTITYALQQLIYLRPTQEIETFIYVAPAIYSENLIITGDSIKVIKDDSYSGDVIIDGVGQDVITIDGAHHVVVSGVSVRNGKKGILGKSGSSFEVISTTVQDSAQEGLTVDENSAALLSDCTILNSGNDGIEVQNNSSATFSGNIVSNENGMWGLVLNRSSSAFFTDTNITTNLNSIGGIGVTNSSSLLTTNSEITCQNNTAYGIDVGGASSIVFYLTNNMTSEGNGFCGLCVFESSAFKTNPNSTMTLNENGRGIHVDRASSIFIDCPLLIENSHNRGIGLVGSSRFSVSDPADIIIRGITGQVYGIHIALNSTFHLWGGSLLVENIEGDGIQVIEGSILKLEGPALSTKIIRNNTGRGVFVDDGGTIKISGSSITGNAGGDLKLEFGSRATLNGNTIGSLPISCDGTVLSRGDNVCP